MSYKPFLQLRELLLQKEKDPPKEHGSHSSAFCQKAQPAEDDITLFKKAMADVTPLADSKNSFIPHCSNNKKTKNKYSPPSEKKVENELKALIQGKGDFRISDTSEYMEGLAPGIHKCIAERLHNRFFSYQDHIDLHGLCVKAAYEVFNEFMKASIEKGLNCVLIIHGRGKSSPGLPKLKQAVRFWLTRGLWRKWVLAFSSAQIYDGGAGATYVLLSHRPIKSMKRKKRNRKLGSL